MPKYIYAYILCMKTRFMQKKAIVSVISLHRYTHTKKKIYKIDKNHG